MLCDEQAAPQPTLSQQLHPQHSPQQEQMQAQNQANLFEQLAQAASSGAALQKVHFGSRRHALIISWMFYRQASLQTNMSPSFLRFSRNLK